MTSARAAIGHALPGDPLPVSTFPGTAELRQLLGAGDLEEDPVAPLRERVAELNTPQFHL